MSERKSLGDGVLPNVLVIGAAKCGTTSLHNYLQAHPEISMSNVKELDFFSCDDRWARGTDWYKSQFHRDARVRGESSTSYTRDHRSDVVVARIRDVLADDVKFIYLVRDPVDRARSDYHQHLTAGLESRTIDEALRAPGNPYMEASMYARRLKPFVRQFGRDSILVETQERLLTRRRECLQGIFQFLGVDESLDLSDFDRVWNRSEGKGWAYRLGWKIRERGVRLPRVLRWPAQRLQRTRVLGGSGGSSLPPEIGTDLHQELAQALRPEVSALENLTGMAFDSWLD